MTQRKNLGIHISTLNTLQAEFQLWFEEKSTCGFKSDLQLGIFGIQGNYYRQNTSILRIQTIQNNPSYTQQQQIYFCAQHPAVSLSWTRCFSCSVIAMFFSNKCYGQIPPQMYQCWICHWSWRLGADWHDSKELDISREIYKLCTNFVVQFKDISANFYSFMMDSHLVYLQLQLTYLYL